MANTTTKMLKLSFQWDIKDFDDCDLEFNDFFDSPRFFATDPTFKSDWKLRVYPAGLEDVKKRYNLSLLLLRLDSGSVFHIRHTISLLNRCGNRNHTESRSELHEPSRCTHSSSRNLNAKNIVEIKKNTRKFLDGGVLSILCEIEIYDKTDEIQVAIPENSVQMRGTSWVIPNIYNPIKVIIPITGESVIFFLPYGKVVLCLSGAIKSRTDCLDTTSYHIVFEIIDRVHLEIEDLPIRIVYNTRKTAWNIQRSPSSTLRCFTHGSVALEISTRCMVKCTPDATLTDITPYVREMQSDFQKMFLQSEFGDTSIAVDGKVLRVHKDILSSRCPVFAAMFSHEWREQATQTVTIKDFDFKTILAMIVFIYCGGGSDDSHDENAVETTELLKAAHMYQLDGLKRKCEQRLSQILEKKNVVKLMGLAETYDLPNLKNELQAVLTTP